MNTIKETLLAGWNIMRWLRLGFGIFFAVEAFTASDKLFAAAAAFLLFTAIFNIGCFGSSACPLPKGAGGSNRRSKRS